MPRFVIILPICALLIASACSQSPQRLVAAGDRYHDKQKYQEASILYRKAIAKDKKYAAAYYREGLNLLDQKKDGDAARFLRRAVDLNPSNTDAAIKLAQIYLDAYALDQKRFEHLLPEIKDLSANILGRNPNDYHGVRLQAFLYLAGKDIPKAVEAFQRANQLKPYSRDVVGWLAESLAANNQFDQAETLMREMIARDKTWGPAYDFLFLQYSKRNRQDDAGQALKERIANDPSNSIAYVNYSNYLVSRGRSPEGEAVIRRVLNDRKAFPDAHKLVGDFYTRAGKLSQAVDQYNAGIKDDEKNELVYQQRIVAVLAREGLADPAKKNDAIQLAKKLAGDHPTDLTTNEMYASLLLETGLKQDVQKSIGELKRLVETNNTDAALHLDLARGYYFEHDLDKSLAEALEAVRLDAALMPAHTVAARIYEDRGQHGQALAQTDIVLAQRSDSPEARFVRDQALMGLKQYDKAQPELESLVKQHPHYTDAIYELANLYASQKEYGKAQAQYENLWRAGATNHPADFRGFIGLQNLKMQRGQWREATAAIRDLVEKYPAQPQLHLALANFEAEAADSLGANDPGRRDLLYSAASEYARVLKTNPQLADVWLRLGITQRMLNQNDAALTSFNEALRANPSDEKASLSRATLLEAMGRQAQARDAYNHVLGINPDNGIALNNLAFLNAKTGQNLDMAMTLAERAKKRMPGSPNVSDTLGYVYYEKNLTGDAVRELQQAVDAAPLNATFRLHLAMALLKSGDKPRAKREAESALQHADSDQQQQIRGFLGKIG
jgi:tetratricopeptide (TPR) repeat protein